MGVELLKINENGYHVKSNKGKINEISGLFLFANPSLVSEYCLRQALLIAEAILIHFDLLHN